MDETVAKEFQRRCLEGEGRALSGLYAELRYMGDQILRGRPDAADLSHQAASRLVERYMRHPGGYRIRHFGYMVSREVAHALADGGNGHRATRECRLVEEPANTIIPDDEIQPIDYVKDLQRTSVGRRVLLDLWSSWGYQRAMLTIAEYVGRSWIYARAMQLHTVYRMMHCGKKSGARQSGRKGLAGDKAAVQGIWAELQLRCEPNAHAVEQSEAER